ncbi:hypothetical protein [Microbacterium sp. B35-04]|uniref:hypothetical protein n=1 Tax=Microbacterium sp. B35-04 TaxID=1961716 RepID=UPI0013D636AF|nr:hypothetical protein [Microbacterium sp. B35-04]
MGEPVSGWWRRNAVALGALVILVPALGATVTWHEWSEANSGALAAPVVLEQCQHTRYGDAVVGPAAADFVDDPLAPPDARVLKVQIDIDPGASELACAEPMLRELKGLKREWDADTSSLTTDWDPLHPASCSSDVTERYTLDVRYVVPQDAAGPFAVDMISAELWPENVRFIVEP